MSAKHTIETYSKLADGANFYLTEAFSYINICLQSELRNSIFGELIAKIDHTDEDERLLKEYAESISDDIIENLKPTNIDVLSDKTINSFRNAWQKSKNDVDQIAHKFDKQHKITSIEK